MDFYTTLLNLFQIVFVAILVRSSLYRVRYFLHMFQLKGYKTREMWSWISDHFSNKVITTEHVIINLLILSLLYFLSARLTPTSVTIILGIFILFWFVPVDRFRQEKEKKPLVFTARMKRLAVTLSLYIILLWYATIELAYTGSVFDAVTVRQHDSLFLSADPYILAFGFILTDILVPFFMMSAAYAIKPVERYIQNGFKKKARKKLASLPHLKVVAITGSYGKTSTKFFLETFLRERYNVCVTPGSFNTPMGICKVINNDLNASHQVLILEMGARYPGNILELCNIAAPDVSIITNIGVAHLETFGSRETLAYEKATLARELKQGGTLVLNGDDERVAALDSLRDDVKVVKAGENGAITASNITYGEEGSEFDLIWKNADGETESSYRIKTGLLGNHNIENIVIAAAAASELGIRPQTIAVAAKNLKPVKHRLELKKEGNIYIIDDAFNSNPTGAENAVEILTGFKTGRKVIVTPGMIELGDLQEQANRTFGEQIAKAGLDLVILVGKSQTKPIYEGIQTVMNGKPANVRVVNSLFEANDYLRSYLKPGDVVLYENDLPDTFNEG